MKEQNSKDKYSIKTDFMSNDSNIKSVPKNCLIFKKNSIHHFNNIYQKYKRSILEYPKNKESKQKVNTLVFKTTINNNTNNFITENSIEKSKKINIYNNNLNNKLNTDIYRLYNSEQCLFNNILGNSSFSISNKINTNSDRNYFLIKKEKIINDYLNDKKYINQNQKKNENNSRNIKNKLTKKNTLIKENELLKYKLNKYIEENMNLKIKIGILNSKNLNKNDSNYDNNTNKSNIDSKKKVKKELTMDLDNKSRDDYFNIIKTNDIKRINSKLKYSSNRLNKNHKNHNSIVADNQKIKLRNHFQDFINGEIYNTVKDSINNIYYTKNNENNNNIYITNGHHNTLFALSYNNTIENCPINNNLTYTLIDKDKNKNEFNNTNINTNNIKEYNLKLYNNININNNNYLKNTNSKKKLTKNNSISKNIDLNIKNKKLESNIELIKKKNEIYLTEIEEQQKKIKEKDNKIKILENELNIIKSINKENNNIKNNYENERNYMLKYQLLEEINNELLKKNNDLNKIKDKYEQIINEYNKLKNIEKNYNEIKIKYDKMKDEFKELIIIKNKYENLLNEKKNIKYLENKYKNLIKEVKEIKNKYEIIIYNNNESEIEKLKNGLKPKKENNIYNDDQIDYEIKIKSNKVFSFLNSSKDDKNSSNPITLK